MKRKVGHPEGGDKGDPKKRRIASIEESVFTPSAWNEFAQSVSLAWHSLGKCAREELGKQRDAEECRTSINAALPVEMLMHVLSFCDPVRDLRRVCLVCHMWNDIAWDASDITRGDNFAIREASERGCVEAVQRLLACKGVNPAACESGAIRQVLHAITVQSMRNFSPVLGGMHKYKEVLRLLIADGRANSSVNGGGLLFFAARAGWADVVELLLADERVDPSVRDDEAIVVASENGHAAVVALLALDTRVNPDARDHWPIRVAGRAGVVRVLRGSVRVNTIEFDEQERQCNYCMMVGFTIVFSMCWFFCFFD